jgi:hypothetical protein
MGQDLLRIDAIRQIGGTVQTYFRGSAGRNGNVSCDRFFVADNFGEFSCLH